MPSTRSRSKLPDKVIHEYPKERKSRIQQNLTGKIRKIPKSTNTIETIDQFGPVTSTPIVVEPSINKESITVVADVHQGELTNQIKSPSGIDIVGQIREITKTLSEINSQISDDEEEEVESQKIDKNKQSLDNNSFVSAVGQTTPKPRKNKISELKSLEKNIASENINSSTKSCSKSVSPRRKSAPANSGNLFGKIFGLFGEKKQDEEHSKSSNISGEASTKSDGLHLSRSFTSFSRLASLTEGRKKPKQITYTVQKVRLGKAIGKRVKTLNQSQKPKISSINSSPKMLPITPKNIARERERENREERRDQPDIHTQNGDGDDNDDDDRRNRDKNSRPSRRMTTPNVTKPILNLSSGGMGNLRDALRLIPEFDGKRNSLNRYIAGLEDGLEMVGEEFEHHLLKLAKSKLVGDIWDRVAKNDFESLDEYIEYLRTTFDPPRDIYQLQGELGSSAQLDEDTVDQFAHRIREIAEKIREAHYYKSGCLDEGDREVIDNMALSCFKRGLKPEIQDKMVRKETTLRDAINEAKFIEREIADRNRLRESANAKNKQLKEGEKGIKKANIKVIDSEKDNNQVAVVNTTHVVPSCDLCGRKGHTSDKCWQALGIDPPKCHNCDKIGHTADKCKSGVKNSGVQVPVTCQICQKTGHLASQCFKLPGNMNSNGQSGLVTCQICQKTGHLANQCFKLQGNVIPNVQTGLTVCQICGKRGHTADKCYSIPCRICGRTGHLPETCRQAQQSGSVPVNQSRPQNNVQTQSQNIQCQLCNKWGHPASTCFQLNQNQDNQGLQGATPIPSVNKGQMTYSQAVTPQGMQNNQIFCNYCKNFGHLLADCQIRLSNNNRRAADQGNGGGQPAQGAQVKAIRSMEVHPPLSVQASINTGLGQK